MSGRGNMQTIAIVAGVIGLVLLVALAFRLGAGYPSAKAIQTIIEAKEAQLKEEQAVELARLNGEIERLRGDLKQSQGRHARLKALIMQKAREAQEITPPATVEETKERFRKLGHQPL